MMPLTDEQQEAMMQEWWFGAKGLSALSEKWLIRRGYNHALEEAAQMVTERREGYLDYYTETRRGECQGIIEAIRALKEEE